MPLLAALAPEDLQRIAMVAGERSFAPGEALVREGDLGTSCSSSSRAVRVVHADPDGTEHLLRTYEEGDHIGELAVLRERSRATVIADGVTVRTLVIGGEGLTAILRERLTPRWPCWPPSPSGSARSDEPSCSRRSSAARPPDRDGHVPADGRRGSMGLCAPSTEWDDLNAAHLGLITASVRRHGGAVVRTEGDAVFAAFPEAGAGSLRWSTPSEPSPPTPGRPARRSGSGWGCTRARRTWPATTTEAGTSSGGRIAAVGHGGQILVSGPTAALIADRLPAGTALRDLGSHRLRDVPRPEDFVQVDVEGLSRPTSHCSGRPRP